MGRSILLFALLLTGVNASANWNREFSADCLSQSDFRAEAVVVADVVPTSAWIGSEVISYDDLHVYVIKGDNSVTITLDLPPFTTSLLWHERGEHDPAHAWLRDLIATEAARL